jgi:hypothetical protein
MPASRRTARPAAAGRTRTPPRTRPPAAPRALVTGASAGIGTHLAREFAARGHDLVLVARSRERLRELAGELASAHGREVAVVPLDLAQPESPRRLFDTLRRRRIGVDVLVNNAGVLQMGRFDAIDGARHAALIDLNVRALTALTHLFLAPMLAAGRGRILNVASIAAFHPLPLLASYAATKAFVLALSEGLATELAGSGVSVTALCPGVTDTAMYGQIRHSRKATARLPDFMVSDPREVARAGVQACLDGRAICVPGLVNELTALGGSAMPRRVRRALWGAAARMVGPD